MFYHFKYKRNFLSISFAAVLIPSFQSISTHIYPLLKVTTEQDSQNATIKTRIKHNLTTTFYKYPIDIN